MRLYCNNKSAISIEHNLVQNDRTKNIEVDRHFIKEKLNSGIIYTLYISTTLQFFYVLTKGLSNLEIHMIIFNMGIDNVHSPVRGEVFGNMY